MGPNVSIRRANANDAVETAAVFGAARKSMSFLPQLHTDEETRDFICGIVAIAETWIALRDRIVGLACLRGDWLEHLYVDPAFHNRGIGSALLAKVKERRPGGFRFWVFQANTGARRFYQRHGCKAVEFTDGSGNEEKLPDVLYTWRRVRTAGTGTAAILAAPRCRHTRCVKDARSPSDLRPIYDSANWRNSPITAFTAAATIFSPASTLAWLGSEPMRPSGKRRR